jgi:hypothetical protein
MDKKLLMKVGIGAGVLVLGYLAYKKFYTKPAETKSAESEEATPNEATDATSGTKSSEAGSATTDDPTNATPRTTKKITTTTAAKDLVSSPPTKRKQRITSEEVEKIKAERKRLKELGLKGVALQGELKAFATKNDINFEAFQQLRQRNLNTLLANQNAGFMDFDTNDRLGRLM